MIGAIQLVSSIEAFFSSGRLSDVKYLFEGQLLPIQHLITFLVPDFFGNPATYNYWGSGFYHERMIFVGIIPLILILLALLTKKLDLPHSKFFKIAFLVTLSLGFSLPTSWFLLYYLQILVVSTMSPTRIFTLIIFCASVLTAYGSELFVRGISKKVSIFVTLILATAIFAVWVFIIYWRLLQPGSPEIASLQKLILSTTLRNVSLSTALVGISLMALWLHFYFSRCRGVFLVALFAVTLTNIFLFTNKYFYFSDRRLVFPKTPVLTKLKEVADNDRFWTYDNENFASNFAVGERLNSPEGYDALANGRYNELLSLATSGDESKKQRPGLMRSSHQQTILMTSSKILIASACSNSWLLSMFWPLSGRIKT